MQNTTKKSNLTLKTIVAVFMSVLITFSVIITTLAVVSAEQTTEPNFIKYQTHYTVSTVDGYIPNINTPADTEAFISITVEEDGYYSMCTTRDIYTDRLPLIVIRDENREVTNYSDDHENYSILMMYLTKGEYEVELINTAYNSELNTTFNTTSFESYINSYDFEKAETLTLGTSLTLNPKETRVFRIENTKDDYYNYLCANDDNLRVQVLDANFANIGYDSSSVGEIGKICQYIGMTDYNTDFFYAIVSNDSKDTATLHYITEQNIYYFTTDVIKPNLKNSLNCVSQSQPQQGNSFYFNGEFQFTSKQTKEHDFVMSAPGLCSAYLTITEATTGEIVSDLSSDFSDGEHTFEGIKLEANKVYAIFSCVYVTTDEKQATAELMVRP